MNNSLYSIFVNSNWLRIQAVDLDHVTLHVMHLKEINRVLLSINASIWCSEWHQFVEERRHRGSCQGVGGEVDVTELLGEVGVWFGLTILRSDGGLSGTICRLTTFLGYGLSSLGWSWLCFFLRFETCCLFFNVSRWLMPCCLAFWAELVDVSLTL